MFLTLDIEDYNELSFVVRGETGKYQKDLKLLGGRWNPNLKGGPGWLFNKKRHGKVVGDYVIDVNKEYDKRGACIVYTIVISSAVVFSWLLVCCC